MPLNFVEIESVGAFDCSSDAVMRKEDAKRKFRFIPASKTFAAQGGWLGKEKFKIVLREKRFGSLGTELVITSSNLKPNEAEQEINEFIEALKKNNALNFYTSQFFGADRVRDGTYTCDLSSLDELQLEQFWNVLRNQDIFPLDGVNADLLINKISKVIYPKFLGQPAYVEMKKYLSEGEYAKAIELAKKEDETNHKSDKGILFQFDYTYLVARLLLNAKQDYFARQAFEYLRHRYTPFAEEASEQCTLMAIAEAKVMGTDAKTQRTHELYAIERCLYSNEVDNTESLQRQALLLFTTKLTGNRPDVKQALAKLEVTKATADFDLSTQIIGCLADVLKQEKAANSAPRHSPY